MSDDAPDRAAKAPPPELSTRAPRPRPVRVRRGAAIAVGLIAAGLLGGALAWSFVVHPRLRQAAAAQAAPAAKRAQVASRPSEIITRQPASYLQPSGTLPPPRRLNAPPAQEAPPAAPRGRPAASSAREPGGDLAAQAGRSTLLFEISAPALSPSPSASAVRSPQPPAAGSLRAPATPYVVQAGAILPATLLTAIDTSRPGAVVAVTSQAVFDTVTGKILLIPQGARLIGKQDGASTYGDRRAFLIWERLILPNGKSLDLDAEPGVDAQGAHGVRGRADRRLWPLAQASLFAGAITALGQAARDRDDDSGGWLGDAGDAAAIQAAQVGGRLIDRELDVAPSIRLDAGAPVRVLLTHDLSLEPYAP